MISSEIFHQKLQAGQIHEALALVMKDASELDVITRMTEDPATSQSARSEYLRTKINLLTGEIYNEVGKDAIEGSTSYIKLQQLHIDQIVVSHRLVQGYLARIEAILTVLDSSPLDRDRSSALPSQSKIERLSSADLVTRLTQAAAQQSSNVHQYAAVPVVELISIDRPELARNNDDSTTIADPQPSPQIFQPLGSGNIEQPHPLSSIDDDDLDLSIDPAGTVWEEWVEDEDFLSGSLVPPPAATTPPPTIPDRQERWGRQLTPIDVKPTIARTHTESTKSTLQWDRFEPEYIEIGTTVQPPPSIASDARQMKRPADLDI